MKFIAFTLALFLSLSLSAQHGTDTLTILYNYSKKPIKSGLPVYVGLAWKEGKKWHKMDYYYPSSTIQMDGYYADKDFKIKDGLFTTYHANQMMDDSCAYINGKKTGTEINWDSSGNQLSVEHWANDLPVDTAIWYNKEGGVTAFQVTDSMGNGFYKSLLKDGKSVRVEGRMLTGLRSGKWIFKDVNGVRGVDAIYDKDSVIAITCYNENGEVESGKNECMVEKPAEFKGGLVAWRKYLEKNLKYPEKAVESNIQGLVRVKFTVNKDGSLSDFGIVESPDEMLSMEALRIMKSSGN